MLEEWEDVHLDYQERRGAAAPSIFFYVPLRQPTALENLSASVFKIFLQIGSF